MTYSRGFQPPRVPRNTRRTGAGCLFVLWFAFCGLLGLGLLGVLVWAVISLVNWIVAQ